MANRKVLVHGLPYFGQLFVDLMNGEGWDFRFYPDSGINNLTAMMLNLMTCDVAYQIGGRVTLGKFLRMAKFLRKKRIVIHWVGTDTLDERAAAAAGKGDPWVRKELTHWAETAWLSREVDQLGASCDIVPLPGARFPEQAPPLPREFSVLVYVPGVSHGAMYGLNSILGAARQLPQIRFELVGLTRGSIDDPPPNLRIHGHVPNMNEFYERSSVIWRPITHDGLSFMVLEALAFGRHVIWSYPFPGCIHASSEEEAVHEILRLNQLHLDGRLPLNRVGLETIREDYQPHSLRKQILARLEKLLET